MIKVNADPEFSTAHFEIAGYKGEFDDGGQIEIEAPCLCGYTTTVSLTADELRELLEQVRVFGERREGRAI